ncbi:response regulator transcription factor [Nocardia sp. NBC_01503]|uniref:response regulator transcription factor n=1 Tax=Nocardia sp. NBC_01503 TaxID=2975997 RepID=UPI002E7AFDB9|nr:response regulator transcription factor [Nocardia sp. NBC_01503]WTL30496.1 response regulator transcription factor [Nocardia sp. NBC_01503]
MIKVFLVDDHEIVRRGLVDLLNSDPDLSVIGEAGTVSSALARIPALRPDVAVLDVRLPDGNGVELCRDLLSTLDDLRCLILTSFDEEQAMLDAVLAGASGYAIKDIRGFTLIAAVKQVGQGDSMLDHRAAAALMRELRRRDDDAHDSFAGLSEQEHQILDLLGEGMTNRQIGERMFLAEKTIKNYVSRLLTKLDLDCRTQAAVLVAQRHTGASHGSARR